MNFKKTEILERLENLYTFGFTRDGNILVKQEDWFWLQEKVEHQQQEIEKQNDVEFELKIGLQNLKEEIERLEKCFKK
ncbi:hypothetical protein [Robertmurraya siralis]|uniref:hypothetical protein n=1 Tax=Robertmurraya siralis TaxID=77777 RepID=UPI0010F8F6B2|nr:hypothetical protein [Robertmurraya siralis]